MFSIEAENERGRRWVSAICRERVTAQAFLASVPDDLKSIQRLVEIPHDEYPLFILERDGFAYGDVSLVSRCLAALEPSGDEDAVLLNIYVLEQDHTPRFPGRDCMGSIRHWHITDWWLAPPHRQRLEDELRGAGSRHV